jgi:uncharacterized membrane protein
MAIWAIRNDAKRRGKPSPPRHDRHVRTQRRPHQHCVWRANQGTFIPGRLMFETFFG